MSFRLIDVVYAAILFSIVNIVRGLWSSKTRVRRATRYCLRRLRRSHPGVTFMAEMIPGAPNTIMIRAYHVESWQVLAIRSQVADLDWDYCTRRNLMLLLNLPGRPAEDNFVPERGR